MSRTVRERIVGSQVRGYYRRSLLLRTFVKFLPLGIVLLAWEATSGALVSETVLPPFSTTAGEIYALGTSSMLYVETWSTLLRGTVGLLVAVGIAVPIGLAMSQSKRIERALNPIVSLTYPVPKSPLIPLMVFWLGSGHLSRIMLAVIGAILPILISTHNGANEVREEFVWIAQSLGLSRIQRARHVVFPAALPTILTGVRIGLIFSFIIVISSELINSSSGGMGTIIVDASQFGLYDQVFATVFWIAFLVAGLDRLYLLLSRYLLRWSDQEVGSV